MVFPRCVVSVGLCAAALTSGALAVAPCTTSETAQLDALAASFGGLLHVCKTDAGFDLYPFAGFPPSDKSTVVCNGRACPSVIFNFLQATLPECTVDVQGKAMTPTAYLRALCPADGAASTTAPPAVNNNATTKTPVPTTTTTPTQTTVSPTTTTTTPTPTAAETTKAPQPSDGSNASAGSLVGTNAPTVGKTPSPSDANAVRATAAPVATKSAGVTTAFGTMGVVVLAVLAQLL